MINFFDLGMNQGVTTKMFMNDMERAGIENYKVYGFEPNSSNFKLCSEMFAPFERVQVFQLAVGDLWEKVKLFKSSTAGAVGDSIFPDKGNCDANQFEWVDCVRFSQWFMKHIPPEDFNIVKTNIEGAEYKFYNEMIDSGVYKHIHIFCGMNEDPQKIPSLQKFLPEYYQKLKDHGITIHMYTDPAAGLTNFDIAKEIKCLIK